MLYSNIKLLPKKVIIQGKEEYCVMLGDENSKRPLVLVCDKNTVVNEGMNEDLSIEYYNERFFRIKKYKETTCYFLINSKTDFGKVSVRIKITKKEYPHFSVLAKGYDDFNLHDIMQKADYALLRAPSWYGIIRIKTITNKGFYNEIFVVKDSKVYKFKTKNLLEGLKKLGINDDFIIYDDGNFEGRYWLVL